jgi:hypothetical protein
MLKKLFRGSSLRPRRSRNKLDLKLRRSVNSEAMAPRPTITQARRELEAGLLNLQEDALDNGSLVYHEQQEKIVRRIIEAQIVGFIAFLVCALCQSGKTEVILAYMFIKMQEDPNFNPDNFVVLTGMNSVDWSEQMASRFPKLWFRTNVFRRSGSRFKNADEKDLARVIEGRENITLVIDEIHLVKSPRMSIGRMFESVGLNSEYDFASRNISVIGLSATPGKVQNEFEMFWTPELYLPMRMDPGEGYTGLQQLFDSGRVRQCSPFIVKGDDERPWINLEVVADISRIIREMPFKTINFVRVPVGWDPSLTSNQEEARRLFTSALREDVCIRSYTQRDQGVTLDGILASVGMRLSGEPNQHSIIFLVDKFRVSKTLSDPRFLGVMYDRGSGTEDVTIQGLAGRICGYKTNAHSVVFTDLVHVRRYLRWWNDGCRANPGRGRRAQTWAGRTGSSNYHEEANANVVKYIPIYLECNDDSLFSSLRVNKSNPTKKIEILRTYLFKNSEKNKQIIDVLDTREVKEFQEVIANTTMGRFETIKKNAISNKVYCDTINFKTRNWDAGKCCTISWREGEIVFNIFDILENAPNN